MKWVNSLDRDRKVSDSGAIHRLSVIEARGQKASDSGPTGYCMGGNASLTAAGAFPDRFAAIAFVSRRQFGHRETRQSASLCEQYHWTVYVAGAIEDASFPEEQKLRPRTGVDGGRREPCGGDLC